MRYSGERRTQYGPAIVGAQVAIRQSNYVKVRTSAYSASADTSAVVTTSAPPGCSTKSDGIADLSCRTATETYTDQRVCFSAAASLRYLALKN